MNVLVAIGVGLVGSDLFLAGLFRMLMRSSARPYLRWWTLAWLVSAFGSVMGTAQLLTHAPALELLAALSMLAFASLLMRGAFELAGRPMPRLWWFAAPGSVAIAGVSQAVGVPWPLPSLAPMLFFAAASLTSGVIVLRDERASRSVRRLAAASIVLHGLHFLDFPFLAGVEAFVPFGMMLTLALRSMNGAAFVLLHVERTRRELEASEERYRSLFEDAADGIVRTSLEGTILAANPALARILGHDSAEQLVGLDGRTIYARPDDRGRVIASADSVGGEHEIEVLRRDGSHALVVPAVRAIRGPDGVVTSYQAMIRDVTRPRQLERELLRAQRLESVGRLAGGVAHDFNNLLTVIDLNAELIAAGGGKPAELAAEIRDATARASGLTRQLLTFAGRQPRAPRSFELVPAVRGMLEMLSRTVGPDLRLDLEASDERLAAFADPSQVEQVVMNLVLNARDAMPSGGAVTVRVERDSAPGKDGRRMLRLEVHDEGEGIAPEVLPHIFEPFFTTKGTGKGTGLGLATVHGIVTRGGGSIDVRSRVGEGTTFCVRLPEAEPGTLTSVTPAKGGEPVLSGAPRPARVLLVDDESAVRRLCRRVLEDAGFTVVEAESGARALEELEGTAARVDVLLSDVLMPGMSGTELAARARERHPELPVVLVSGFADGRDDEIERLGARFVPKPFSPAQLVDAVRAALRPAGASGVG